MYHKPNCKEGHRSSYLLLFNKHHKTQWLRTASSLLSHGFFGSGTHQGSSGLGGVVVFHEVVVRWWLRLEAFITRMPSSWAGKTWTAGAPLPASMKSLHWVCGVTALGKPYFLNGVFLPRYMPQDREPGGSHIAFSSLALGVMQDHLTSFCSLEASH